MAPTRLYQPLARAPVVPVAAGSWGVDLSGGAAYMMTPFKIGTAMASSVASWTAGLTAKDKVWVSGGLVGDGTLDGAVRANHLALSPGSANARTRLEVYVVSADGTVLRGVALAIGSYDGATAFNTSFRNKSWSTGSALSPVSYRDGDHIVVVEGYADASGTTPTATSQYGDVMGSTDLGVDETDTSGAHAGWIDFSKALSFYVAGVRQLAHGLINSGSSQVTASISPSNNSLVLLYVHFPSNTITCTPQPSNGGLVWNPVIGATSILGGGPPNTVGLFRAMTPFPTSGTITLSFSSSVVSGGGYSIIEVLGVATSGSQGADAIAQSVWSGVGLPNTPTPNPSFVFNPQPTPKPMNAVLSWFHDVTTYNPTAADARPGWGFVDLTPPSSGTGVFASPSFDGTASIAASAGYWHCIGIEVNVVASAAAGGGGGGGGGSDLAVPVPVLGPGGLLFQVDERTAAVWHFDEPDGVEPSDVAGNVVDLAPPGTLVEPIRAPGIVGYGRTWQGGDGLGGKDAVAGATTLRRTMALEAVVFPNGEGTRTILQRGLNTGTADERIIWALKLTIAGGKGTLQMAWHKDDDSSASVPGQDFQLPANPWLYLAAVRRWVSTTMVLVDYYANGVPIGTATSTDGDITAGDLGTVLVGVTTSAPTSGMLVGDIIDEIRVSNGERTAEEIRQVFRRLFVFPIWARSMAKAFLPPGRAYSDDPGSYIQREVAVEGDGMAHAWHLADSLLDDFWPDRATQTLERWEGITRQQPHPGAFYSDRRSHVVTRLSTIEGFARDKIAAAIAPVLDCQPTDLQFIERSNRFEETFAAALASPWISEPGGGAVSVSSGALHLSFASGHDARWSPPTNITPARVRVGMDAWSGTEMRALISSLTLANSGDMAGVFAWNYVTGDAHLWGVRNNGSALEFAHVGIVAGAATMTIYTGPAVPSTPFWLRLHELDGLTEVSYGTTGWDGPWVPIAQVVSIAYADWGGTFLSSSAASPASSSSASFDEFRLWMPESVAVFLWFVHRDPILGGAPDYRTAQALLEVLAPAHTLGVLFGTIFLTDDTNSLTDNQLLGD